MLVRNNLVFNNLLQRQMVVLVPRVKHVTAHFCLDCFHVNAYKICHCDGLQLKEKEKSKHLFGNVAGNPNQKYFPLSGNELAEDWAA